MVGVVVAKVTPRGRHVVQQAVVALAALRGEEVRVVLEPALKREREKQKALHF